MIYTLFMIAVTGIGILGTLARGPIWGVGVYYFFAVLRPQYLWQWALPNGVAWSWYVAMAALVRVAVQGVGVLSRPTTDVTLAGTSRFNAAHWVFLAFAGWICLTYFLAFDREFAAPFFAEYQKIFVMYVVGALSIRRMSGLWTLYVLATVALGYIAYELNMRYLQQGVLDIYRRGYGGLDNNGAGLMIAMGIPLALYAWEGTKGRARWIFLAFVPFMLHAVLMSYSRGAMLSLVLCAPAIWLRSSVKRYFTFAFIALALMVPIFAGEEIRQRFFSIKEAEQDESANSRFMSWKAAIAMANDHPVFGVGVRNANLYSFKYGADMQGRTIHSQYFQIAADNGYIGLGLYLSVFGSAFFFLRGVRVRSRSVRTDISDLEWKARSAGAGIECSLLVYSIGSVFLSLETFELPYLLLLLSAQLGGFTPSAGESLNAVGGEATSPCGGTSVTAREHAPDVRGGR